MATSGIVAATYEAALRFAYAVEGRFSDVVDLAPTDGGETRPEYLRVYRHSVVTMHPDGVHAAVTLDDAATAAWATYKADIEARRASGNATADEIAFDNLPADAPFDSTWQWPDVSP